MLHLFYKKIGRVLISNFFSVKVFLGTSSHFLTCVMEGAAFLRVESEAQATYVTQHR